LRAESLLYLARHSASERQHKNLGSWSGFASIDDGGEPFGKNSGLSGACISYDHGLCVDWQIDNFPLL
jgi:hypothetical protein